MQSGYTGHVSRSEWWWTTLVSVLMILVAFLPFVVVALTNPAQSNQQFMGLIHDAVNSAPQLSRIQQGAQGNTLIPFLYTAQDHAGALVHPLYAVLGRLQQFIGIPALIIFHVTRIFASLLMFLMIYQLGASIWTKLRTRRIFFVIASLSAGFGWLGILLLTTENKLTIPDIHTPQAFPLYASAANIHYPLAIACLAVLAAQIIAALRPGENARPSVGNGGIIVFLVSLALVLIYPDAILPLAIAFIVNVLVNWYQKRQATSREWYWGLWIIVPALPILLYDLLILNSNEQVLTWLQQRNATTISVPMLLLGFGLPLLIALPALWRALRRFEADGDRFMLIWLLAMPILMYLVPILGAYLLVGIMLPLAYFATRAVEDYWFQYLRRLYRPFAYLLIVPLLVLSHILWLFIPVYSSVTHQWQTTNKLMLDNEYASVFLTLYNTLPDDTVTLAAPDVSLWIPAWTGTHVVYGHPAETRDAATVRDAVESWYQQTDANADECHQLLETYQVNYIFYGSRERALGTGACLDNLELVAASERFNIYENIPSTSNP